MTLKKRKGIETQVPKCRIHCQNTFARLLCQTLTFWFPRWLSGSISSATVSISPIPSTAPPTFHRGRAAPGLPNRWWLVGRIQNFATPPPSVWAGRRPEKKCCCKNKKITEVNQSICTVSRAKALGKKQKSKTLNILLWPRRRPILSRTCRAGFECFATLVPLGQSALAWGRRCHCCLPTATNSNTGLTLPRSRRFRRPLWCVPAIVLSPLRPVLSTVVPPPPPTGGLECPPTVPFAVASPSKKQQEG